MKVRGAANGSEESGYSYASATSLGCSHNMAENLTLIVKGRLSNSMLSVSGRFRLRVAPCC